VAPGGIKLRPAGALAEQLLNEVRPLYLDVDEPAAVGSTLGDVNLVFNRIDLP
jgi:hypothetical protein